MLRVLFVVPILLVLTSALCMAQDKLGRGQGYVFAAPGATLGDGASEGAALGRHGPNYWFRQRYGIRDEMRIYVRPVGHHDRLPGGHIAWALR